VLKSVGRVLAVVCGVLLAAGAVFLARNFSDEPSASGHGEVKLPVGDRFSPERAILPTSDAQSSTRHDIAPAPDRFLGAPHRQAIYDAEAKPGEFVTPPNVSVEH
jgi:hypothetical protein